MELRSDDDETTEEGSILEEDASGLPGERKPKLTDRATMGCYSCGITRSSRFHRWCNSNLAPKLAEIRPERPNSAKICDRCLREYRRKVGHTLPHEVRPSFAICAIGI